MPHFVYKLGEEEYVYWSTIVDAPVTCMLTREEMVEHLMNHTSRDPDEYDYELDKVNDRLDRADSMGSSERTMSNPETPRQLLSFNRMGPDEECLDFEAAVETLREERRRWKQKEAEYEEKMRPKRDRLAAYLKSDNPELDHMLGTLYDCGVATLRDLDHLEYRGWSYDDLVTGKWSIEHEAEVLRLFRKWNQRLGDKVFMEETLVGAMMDSIRKDLGVPFEFET